MIGRKFSPGFSLQLTPSYLHRNLVETVADPNDIFALGAGARLKLSKRISVNAEYFYLFKPDNETLSTAIFIIPCPWVSTSKPGGMFSRLL